MTTELPPPAGSSQPRTSADEKERRDERAETVAIAISLALIVSALAAIIGALLLSRPASTRQMLVHCTPWISALAMSSPGAKPPTSSFRVQAARSGGRRLRSVRLWRIASALLPKLVSRYGIH